MSLDRPVEPCGDLGRPDGLLLAVTIPGDPVCKGRPQHTARGTYTPPRTRAAEQAVALQVRAATQGGPLLCPVAVTLRFHTRTRRRADIDNLAKLVLDACNGVVWADDSQVVELHCFVVRADPEPRTRVTVREVQS